jgi:hypothetical protein
MNKQLLVIGLAMLTAIGSISIAPQSSQAITWEEAAKMFGVFQRYSADIHKTIVAPSQSTNPPAIPVDLPTATTNTDAQNRQEAEVAK